MPLWAWAYLAALLLLGLMSSWVHLRLGHGKLQALGDAIASMGLTLLVASYWHPELVWRLGRAAPILLATIITWMVWSTGRDLNRLEHDALLKDIPGPVRVAAWTLTVLYLAPALAFAWAGIVRARG